MSVSSLGLAALVVWFVGVGLASVAGAAARLPAQELEALSVVARTLGKMDWSFDGDGDVDPCNGLPPWWIQANQSAIECEPVVENNITVHHVTRIFQKAQNLNGSLPRELVGLPSLRLIDLTRNYLNGTSPPEWGSMNLQIISLLGNRLTGPIPLPKELANITTLEELVLEANQFSEAIPSEFGNLTRIRRLLLASNNLTGELPASLAKLTTLEDFRISSNNFTGSIPSYIQNWTNIARLEIQGSGLTGPIPSDLTSLTKLNNLRISDLNGIRSQFPNLNRLTSWQKVILRSCNIEGELQKFIEDMKIDDVLSVQCYVNLVAYNSNI